MEVKIRLPRNVQFIYEHSLAREELEMGFSAEGTTWSTSDPWCLTTSINGSKSAITERSAYAGEIDGHETHYGQLIKPRYQGGQYNRTRSVNQYLTHWIYPYKGKFHPQMIRALINMSGAKPGDLLFEPFVGSGTAALEAQLLGLDVVAVDISPLCVLLTQVKTGAWEHRNEISEIVQRIVSRGTRHDEVRLGQRVHPVVRGFFEIARMVTLSDQANRHRDPAKTYPRNLLAMLESVAAMAAAKERFGLRLGSVIARKDDTRSLSKETRRIRADLIVTSPPYSIALDYVKNDQHALSAMGLDLKSVRGDFIGLAGRGIEERLTRYEQDMRSALSQMESVLKPGGAAIVVIGNVSIAQEERYTIRDFVSWAQQAGFRFERDLPKIVFGLYNVICDEKILFFRKE